jgi:ABC-2 type transport system permease protein
MKIYLNVIKYSYLRYLAYPLEILALIVRRVVGVIFLIVFWKVVLAKPYGEIHELSAYFLIAQGINIITMARSFEYGKFLRKATKSGEINKFLVKPINVIPYTYCSILGENLIIYLIAIIFIIIGIFIYPNIHILSIFQFLIMLFLAVLISFYFNLFEGALSFYIVSVSNITNTLRRIIEVLSGAIVPLTYFPSDLKRIVLLSPFPSVIYNPTAALGVKDKDFVFLDSFLIALTWVVILNFLIIFLWKKGLKHYEAVGI